MDSFGILTAYTDCEPKHISMLKIIIIILMKNRLYFVDSLLPNVTLRSIMVFNQMVISFFHIKQTITLSKFINMWHLSGSIPQGTLNTVRRVVNVVFDEARQQKSNGTTHMRRWHAGPYLPEWYY